jgi:hypothetical protein
VSRPFDSVLLRDVGQAHFISTSRTKISQLEVENAQLKESEMKWGEDRRRYRQSEQDLKDQITILHAQLEAARLETEYVPLFTSGIID